MLGTECEVSDVRRGAMGGEWCARCANRCSKRIVVFPTEVGNNTGSYVSKARVNYSF